MAAPTTPTALDERAAAALFGLLSVASDRPSWLVLHLDLVRAPTSPAFAAVVTAALDAVGALCTHPGTATEAFWSRVFACNMLRATDGGASLPPDAATHVARAVGRDGLKLLLSWEDRPFQAAAATAISAFAQRSRHEDARSIGVGLRVARCAINAAALRALRDVFQRPQATSSSFLVDPTVLHRLDLSENALESPELLVIAEFLASASSRRVQELVFERVTVPPAALTHDGSHCPPFQRVLAAALRGPGVTAPLEDAGLSLSLAHNQLQEHVFDNLHEALLAATRPLRVLSLEGVSTSPGGWGRLARLVFTSAPALNGCQLDVSRLPDPSTLVPAFLTSLSDLVAESMPAIQRALATGNTHVRCRVFDPTLAPPPSSLKHARKARDKALKTPLARPDLSIYDITAVDACQNRVQIATSSGSDPQWVSAASIAWLAVGAGDQIRVVGNARVAALTIDSRIEHNALMYCTDLTIARLVPIVGPNLRYLCLRGVTNPDAAPGAVLHWCPNLEELDVREWVSYRPKRLWRDLDAATFRSLHTVRVSWWNGSESDMTALQTWLEAGAEGTLRCLALRCYSIHSRALAVLAEIVQTLPSRVKLELDWERNVDEGNATVAAEAIAVIDARLDQNDRDNGEATL